MMPVYQGLPLGPNHVEPAMDWQHCSPLFNPYANEVPSFNGGSSEKINAEDIGSLWFSNIVRFWPPLTSAARPAASARPPHKFLHCFSDTKVRLPPCPARLRGPVLPASDLSC